MYTERRVFFGLLGALHSLTVQTLSEHYLFCLLYSLLLEVRLFKCQPPRPTRLMTRLSREVTYPIAEYSPSTLANPDKNGYTNK